MARAAVTESREEAALMREGNEQCVQCCSGVAMAEAGKNERWPSGEYLLELWDTGLHQDPATKKN